MHQYYSLYNRVYLFQVIVHHTNAYQPFWLTTLVILLVGLIGYLYFISRQRLVSIAESFFTLRMPAQLFRDDFLLSNTTSVALSSLFLISTSFYLSKWVQYHSNKAFDSITYEALFLFILLSMVCIYAIKTISIKLLVFIFNKIDMGKEYLFLIYSGNQLFGIILFPFIILHLYSPFLSSTGLIYIGMIVFAMIFCFRIIKSSLSAFRLHQTQVFYIILYFCTLELAPAFIVWKLFQQARG